MKTKERRNKMSSKKPMNRMADLDSQIREIVIEEIKKLPKGYIAVGAIRRGDFVAIHKTPVNDGNPWSSFENALVMDKFDEFCDKLAREFGRSKLAISCKVRRLMRDGEIITW
jgi:hypothetical protein